jgi:hypothetical protein
MKQELIKELPTEGIAFGETGDDTNPARKTLQIQKRPKLLIVVSLVSILLCVISAQAQADYNQPTRFEFYFNGPARGMRFWKRDREIWTETYSSGQKATFRVKKAPYQFRGMTGSLVQKVDETDFFVFIPNLRSEKMEVWTYKAKGPWRYLAKMQDVMPVQID